MSRISSMAARYKHPRKQGGFSLIELVIAMVILGIAVAIISSQFSTSGATSNSSALALYTGSQKLTQNWGLLSVTAGQTTSVTNSIPAATNNALDVLVGGRSYVAAAYQTAWDSAGLVPLNSIAQGTPGGGVYTMQGLAFTMTGGGSNTTPTAINFTAVPDAWVQALVTKYGSNATLSATGDTTNPNVQYGASSASKTRTMTLLFQT